MNLHKTNSCEAASTSSTPLKVSPGFRSRTKVSRSNLVTYHNWTPIFEWCVGSCESEQTPKRHLFKVDWMTSSKLSNNSRFNCQHYDIGGGGPIRSFKKRESSL